MIELETLLQIQSDLRNGASIAEVCRDYEIDFNTLCQNMPNVSLRPYNPKPQIPKSYTGEKFIQKNKGKYIIRKTIKGRNKSFGTYNTLEDAVKVRDYCVEHGWKRQSVDRYCEELGVFRCEQVHGKKVRYS